MGEFRILQAIIFILYIGVLNEIWLSEALRWCCPEFIILFYRLKADRMLFAIKYTNNGFEIPNQDLGIVVHPFLSFLSQRDGVLAG